MNRLTRDITAVLAAVLIVVLAITAAWLTGCGGTGDGSNPAADATGSLTVGVTDAPVDEATAVVVRFTAIELKPASGSAFTIDISPAQSIDLLALADGNSRLLLEDRVVPAGRYEWMRLLVEAQQNQLSSYIDLKTGERFPLFVPSGSESGLKLIRGFTVAAGGASDFTIDFDLRKSIHAPPGRAPNYILKPVLRVVDNLEVGAIAGRVAASLVTADCTPMVYLFSGADVVPDDLDDAAAPDVDPLLSVPVRLDNVSGEYRFRIGFVETGRYTATFTCDGAADTPEGDETLDFFGTRNVSVAAGQTTTIDFAPGS